MAKSFVVNASRFQVICWKVLEILIDKSTTAKISMYREQDPQELRDFFHPSQLEKRFGGEAESPKRFWPPTMPSSDYGVNPNNIMSEEEY